MMFINTKRPFGRICAPILRFFSFATLILIGLTGLTDCTTSKKIIYFQNLDDAELKPLNTAYEAVIKKDDRLTIVVSGPDKLVCAPYNLTINEMSNSGGMIYARAHQFA